MTRGVRQYSCFATLARAAGARGAPGTPALLRTCGAGSGRAVFSGTAGLTCVNRGNNRRILAYLVAPGGRPTHYQFYCGRGLVVHVVIHVAGALLVSYGAIRAILARQIEHNGQFSTYGVVLCPASVWALDTTIPPMGHVRVRVRRDGKTAAPRAGICTADTSTGARSEPRADSAATLLICSKFWSSGCPPARLSSGRMWVCVIDFACRSLSCNSSDHTCDQYVPDEL